MGDSLPRTIAEMYLGACEDFTDRTALTYVAGHHFASVTYGQLRECAFSFATALLAIGIGKGDRILVISDNRPEWVVADFAMACIGAVNVPVHSVLSPGQIFEIVDDARPVAAIISGDSTAERLAPAYATFMAGMPVIVLDQGMDLAGFENVLSFRQLIEAASPTDVEGLLRQALEIVPEDLMSVTFTSGSTGQQKGVLLTHKNLMADVNAGMKAQSYSPEDRFVSVLPLSHVFERVAGLYGPLASGCSVRQIVGLEAFKEAAAEQKPTMLIAVPRLFEKIQEIATEQAASSAVSRRVFAWAFNPQTSGVPVLSALFDKLVYSRVRHVLGGELRCAIIGGAKLPLSVSAFFDRVGIPLLEGYGLTETAPIVSTNTERDNRYGTVGKLLDGVQVEIAADGEVLIKGDIVMRGYIRDEDTAEAFTADGWLKTGDFGRFDEADHLILTGRKKDLLVLTTGKKIAPVGIEEALLASPYIEQACVVGDGRKHICAILVPRHDVIGRVLGEPSKLGLAPGGRAHELIANEAARLTAHLSSVEQVRAFVLAREPFTLENGLMTATLKMKRHEILLCYQAQVSDVYC